jgi:hypothetical protein
VNHETLSLVNGARGGQTASAWDSPTDPEYARIVREWLAPLGLSEKQVQVVWVKVANDQPRASLPAENADARVLERQLGDIVRALRLRYPNVQQVFLSSRIYAGFAITPLNPEPYAYESGFAVKWTVESQIAQMRGSAAGRAGALRYDGPAPWIAWGPYLWAGVAPRSDGLAWDRADFDSDGTHPSQIGERKVGRLLLEFFKGSEVTRCWFLAGEHCGG